MLGHQSVSDSLGAGEPGNYVWAILIFIENYLVTQNIHYVTEFQQHIHEANEHIVLTVPVTDEGKLFSFARIL